MKLNIIKNFRPVERFREFYSLLFPYIRTAVSTSIFVFGFYFVVSGGIIGGVNNKHTKFETLMNDTFKMIYHIFT